MRTGYLWKRLFLFGLYDLNQISVGIGEGGNPLWDFQAYLLVHCQQLRKSVYLVILPVRLDHIGHLYF